MPNSQLTSNNFMEPQLLLKRSINVKVVVTPRWKEEAQQQLQAQINQIDSQLQQLEMQGQRMISEIQKQNLQPPGPQVMKQIENIQVKVNHRKSEMLDLEQEVSQGQIDGTCTVGLGENLIEKMQVEILLRDGIVEEIRGDI